ncbi:hypothetical protein EXT68_22485 [Pectobacterium parmentieri]|uniref:DUF7716 domain-containing protein n=1 Tax=Pectobacterium parmentieri TaxID=1905730 RepID=A0ABS0S3W6_PECPM|nr:hypothetical protein [Pectobacterium parmentieri]MBI0472628.1 hypothetical protein [Pectobacterium parmentieri]MBI0495307.1 hypothetical protein [Pectobacterium parmentieri]MBI0556571.1 hypothetical protein [Pectobacterium parmentieri]MBI0569742.1 hypothetical protein [Pectobacterium parmentieri]MBI0574524.1 hypothetical protein [Pectobacterium parmentieri]
MQIVKKEKIKLSDFIVFVKNNIKIVKEDFCLYCENSDEPLSQDTWCYVDEYPTGDDNGNDVFSDFVVNNDLELLYYGEQFTDVINNVLMQEDEPDISIIIEALNYYMENDDFLDFDK